MNKIKIQKNKMRFKIFKYLNSKLKMNKYFNNWIKVLEMN